MMKFEKMGSLEILKDEQTTTVKVTFDSEYLTREEVDTLGKLITDALIRSIPINNIKCHYYDSLGKCLGQKYSPKCAYSGDARRCEIIERSEPWHQERKSFR